MSLLSITHDGVREHAPRNPAPASSLQTYLASLYRGLRAAFLLQPYRRLVIDDRTSTDRLDILCLIEAVLDETEKFTLTLSNAPVSESVREFVESEGGELSQSAGLGTVLWDLTPADSPRIRRLADLLPSQGGRGRRYEDPNWKWVCPRAADSLIQFAQHLYSFRSLKRQRMSPAS